MPSLSLQSSSLNISSQGMVKYPDEYCYHSAFVSYDGAAPYPDDAIDCISRFTSMVGKGLYCYEVAGTINWNERLWMLGYGGPSYTPLLESGLINVLMISINPFIRDNYDDTQTLKDIVAGLRDDYIRELASECRAFGYLLFIKFGIEPNINQGASGYPSWASNSDDFVAAFRRTVDIFRSQGAANVKWVLALNWEDIGSHHWTEYYPGDEYVDWVGMSIYQFMPDNNPEPMIVGIYNDYSSRKPIMISEWGVNWSGQNYSDESRATFINKFFDTIEARPKIKMINYHFWRDWKFDPSTTPLTMQAYSNRIANPRYVIHTS